MERWLSKTSNLLLDADYAIKKQQWITSSGLNSYTQDNCSCTLTTNGYRIYRPANINPTDQGRTMWGGLKLRNCNNGSLHEYNASTDNIWGFQKGRSYILMFHISGKSSNAPEFYWTNQCGWGGGGLSPSPTDLSAAAPSSNFQGEFDFHYAWTINDNVVKTCTSSYSYAVAGKDYMSYMDFKYGFSYTDTGSLGTDLYITNLRMFDITGIETTAFNKNGNLVSTHFIEQNGVQILRGTEVMATEIVEN